MKRVIWTSLVSLAAFTSVISTDIRPAQANGRVVYHGVRGAYHSAQEGDSSAFLFCAFIVVAGVGSAIANAK